MQGNKNAIFVLSEGLGSNFNADLMMQAACINFRRESAIYNVKFFSLCHCSMQEFFIVFRTLAHKIEANGLRRMVGVQV